MTTHRGPLQPSSVTQNASVRVLMGTTPIVEKRMAMVEMRELLAGLRADNPTRRFSVEMQ